MFALNLAAFIVITLALCLERAKEVGRHE